MSKLTNYLAQKMSGPVETFDDPTRIAGYVPVRTALRRAKWLARWWALRYRLSVWLRSPY